MQAAEQQANNQQVKQMENVTANADTFRAAFAATANAYADARQVLTTDQSNLFRQAQQYITAHHTTPASAVEHQGLTGKNRAAYLQAFNRIQQPREVRQIEARHDRQNRQQAAHDLRRYRAYVAAVQTAQAVLEPTSTHNPDAVRTARDIITRAHRRYLLEARRTEHTRRHAESTIENDSTGALWFKDRFVTVLRDTTTKQDIATHSTTEYSPAILHNVEHRTRQALNNVALFRPEKKRGKTAAMTEQDKALFTARALLRCWKGAPYVPALTVPRMMALLRHYGAHTRRHEGNGIREGVRDLLRQYCTVGKWRGLKVYYPCR